MLTYLAAAARFQSEYRSPAALVAAWFRRQIEAHCTRRAARRTRNILSGLDRRVLADIGVATWENADVPASVAGLSVHAIVAGAIADKIASL